MAKRVRFSIRQLLLLTVSIAAVAAFVSMKGAHVIWASKRIVYWESTDRTRSGEIWFGEGTGNGGWITSVANSIRLELPGQEGLTNSQTMTDDELLSRVRTLR